MRVTGLIVVVVVVTMVGGVWGRGEEDKEELGNTVKFLQEQVTALLEHRQQDYNALEESLKEAMEKNTELIVLRNEIKQLRFVDFLFFYTFV